MSVNNVNSMYQTQGVQNGSAYTYQASDNSEGGVDIGKLLLGAGTAIAIGVTTCAAAKKGKTVSGDEGFLKNVVNGVKSWFGKNTGVKRYVDLGEGNDINDINDINKYLNSLKGTQKIEKTQEIVDAAKNNLQVSNDKALKHMKNIEDITDSLSKGKIDNEIFTKINNTKGLEDAFKLDGDKLIINGDDGLKKVKAYFSKTNNSCLNNFDLAEGQQISVDNLKDLFENKHGYYVIKQNNLAEDIDFCKGMAHSTFSTASLDNFTKRIELLGRVNKKLDFEEMAKTDYYKTNKDLFKTRAQAKGFDNETIEQFITNAESSKSMGG